MKSLFALLLVFGFSHTALAADYEVTGADGWRVVKSEDIELVLGYICPGTPKADFVITKTSDAGPEVKMEDAKPQPALCVRKMKSDKASALSDRKEEWRRALWTPQVLLRMAFINERPIKTADSAKYLVEATFDVNQKVPQKVAGFAQVINGELYFFSFEQNTENYKAGIKDVQQLFKTVSIQTKISN